MHPARSNPPFNLPGATVTVHPLIVRISHWINVLAVLVMVMSGWRIYNASPLFHFKFAAGMTLGGWLAGALQWHFAAMWLLVINGVIYLSYGILSGHYRRSLLPVSVDALIRELGNAFHGRLSHQIGTYNPVQRSAYLGIIAVLAVVVLSGLAMWKPVQLHGLAAVMGGYPGARLVHFFAMAAIVLFLVIHVTMVLLVPRTFLPMWTGRARNPL
jgi:thiosulfate reductase cytochrome b subunit